MNYERVARDKQALFLFTATIFLFLVEVSMDANHDSLHQTGCGCRADKG